MSDIRAAVEALRTSREALTEGERVQSWWSTTDGVMTTTHRRLVDARAAWYALLGTADRPALDAALQRFRAAGRAWDAWLSRIRHHASTRARRRTR